MADYRPSDEEYEDDELNDERPEAPQWTTIEDLATGENVSDLLDASLLDGFKKCGLDGFRADKASRKQWEETGRHGLKLISGKAEAKTWPWPNASNVRFPLLQDALVQFWSRSRAAVIQDDQVVKGKVIGPDPEGAKRKRADRIGRHMSYQKMELSESWQADMSALLMQYAVIGHGFKKCYWSRDNNNPEADFCSAMDVYVNQGTRSLERCPRITYRYPLYPYEIEEKMRDGRFRRVDLGEEPAESEETPRHMLECTLRYDVDGDGLAEPWIVTIDEKSEQVLQVLANFAPEDVKRAMEMVQVPVIDPMTQTPQIDPATFEPVLTMQEMPVGDILRVEGQEYWVDFKFADDPDGNYYGMGLAKLLENIQDAIDTAINQTIDAATIQNAGGGMIDRRLNLNERGGEIRLKLGSMIPVRAAGENLRNSVYFWEHPGPSQALFNVLALLIDMGKGTAMLTDALTGEAPGQQPATTTLALIEQGLQVFGAIFANLWASLRKEYRLTAKLNAMYLTDEAYQAVTDETAVAAREDYQSADADVVPVADPRQVTNMQKMARAQFLGEHLGMPGINNEEIYRRRFEAAGIEDPDSLLAPPDPMSMQGVQLQLMLVASEIAKNLADALGKKAAAVKSIADAEAAESGANIAEYTMALQAIAAIFPMQGAQNGQAAGSAPGGLGGMVGQPARPMAPGVPQGPGGGMPSGMGGPSMGGGPARGGNGAAAPPGGGASGVPAF